MTPEELTKMVKNSGIFSANVETRHVEQVVQKLKYEGKVETVKIGGIEGLRRTKYNYSKIQTYGFADLPCGVCPVFNQCSSDGPITPLNCVYYENWFKNDLEW